MRNFKKFLALVLAALMVASVMVFTAPAASAATDNHAEDIAFLGALDVFKGYSADNLGADDDILRYQMALFLARITTGITDDSFWQKGASSYFTDCNEYTFPAAIDYCAQKGYINGKGDNKFDPYGKINYQEAITMIVRLLGREKKTDVFPIDQYITAATLGLTADVDGALTKALTRKEIADLVVKALYIPVKDADGKDGAALINGGLQGQDLGDAKLVATWNAAIDGHDFANYGEVIFAAKSGDVTVKVANVTKDDVLSMNDYLGFYASLVTVKKVNLATMRNVKVVDANVTADNKIKADGKDFTSFLVYGTEAKNVFVANAGTVAKGTAGKVVICDITNNGTDAKDVIRFIPYNATKALYVAEDVAVYKDTDKGGWIADTKVDVYYVPHTSNSSNGTTVKTDYTYNYEATLRTEYSSALQDRLDSKVVSIRSTALAGLARPDGVSVGTDKIDMRTEFNTKDSSKYATSTSLYVSVIGELKHADVTVCGITNVGNLTFVTIGNSVEVETGKAPLSEISATDLKIGETSLTVGFTKANVAVNNWYTSFANVDAFAKDLLGKEVEYKKVDGKIVALKEYKEAAATTPTPEKTYLTDPFTATPLFVSIKKDAKLTVAEDGTIAIDVLDPNTLTTSTVKFDQINGKKVGALVNQFGYPVAKDILGVTASDLTGAVKELLTTTGNVFDYTATKAKNALYLVTVANKADDVYALSTTNNDAIKHVVLGTGVIAADAKKVIVDDKDGSAKLGFVTYTGSSLSDKALYVGTFWNKTEKTDTAKAQYSFASKYLTVTKNTVINVIAKDGVKSFTDLTPGGEDFLNIVDNGLVLALSNDLVIVVNNDLKIEEIAKFGGAIVAPTEVNGGWYTLTWTTQYVSTTAETVNGTTYFNYTFKDLYNLTTNAVETVVISSTKYYSNEAWETSPAKAFFGATWINTKDPAAPMIDIKDNAQVLQKDVMKDDGKTVKDAKGTRPDGADYTTYDVYFISNERGTEAQASSIYSWGLANGYLVGKITSLIHKDANTFVVENVKLVPEEGVGYTVDFAKGDDSKDYTSVVSWSAFYLNQSTGSSKDEMTSMQYNTGNSGIPTKITANGNISGKPAELILYKVGTDGVATIYTNLADNFTSADATIADTQAK